MILFEYELANEDFKELENQRKNEETEEKEVEPESKHFQTKTMAQAFQMIEDSVTLGNTGPECGTVHQR